MHIRPLGHRILVTPDPQPDETESGLILPTDRDHTATSGTVVALGPGGSLVRSRARQLAVKDALDVIHECEIEWNYPACLQIARENIARLLGTQDHRRELAIGDRVVFPDDVGHRTMIDGEEYLVLNEDDVAVVVAEERERAAECHISHSLRNTPIAVKGVAVGLCPGW